MIDKLEFLIAVARERNFRRAAELSGVTQPTLSAAIKQLEDTLGVLLINRSSRFHGLTPEGERVLEWARRIVGDARAMREDLRGLRQDLTGRLRIAVVPTALAFMPVLINPLRARHPGVRVQILSRSSDQILEMLENLSIDAGVTYLENESLHRARGTPLYTERYQLLVSADSPLATRDAIGWKEISDLPLCLLTADMQNRRIIDRLLADAGGKADPMLETDSVIVLIAHVRDGGWATVVSASMAETLTQPNRIHAVPINQPDATQQIGLVLPDRDPIPALSAALLAEVRRLNPPGPD